VIPACTCKRCLSLGVWNRPRRRDFGQTAFHSRAIGRHVLGHELADMTAMHQREAWSLALAWAANGEIFDLYGAMSSAARIAVLQAAAAGINHQDPRGNPAAPDRNERMKNEPNNETARLAGLALDAWKDADKAKLDTAMVSLARELERLGLRGQRRTEAAE
jgi:hypothetical protein